MVCLFLVLELINSIVYCGKYFLKLKKEKEKKREYTYVSRLPAFYVFLFIYFSLAYILYYMLKILMMRNLF